MNKIYLYGADKSANVESKKAVKDLIVSLFRQENTELDKIVFVFCSDEYLLEMNKQYLDHDTLTDIITFPLSEEGKPVYGEVYISVDRIKENAKIFKASYQNELLRVMIHGALHLCGYTDKTKKSKLQMSERENFYLNQYNVSREANF